MKQEIKTTEAIFPIPLLMISTFNEDGSVDVMNAAWGTMLDRDKVALNLTETHKTDLSSKSKDRTASESVCPPTLKPIVTPPFPNVSSSSFSLSPVIFPSLVYAQEFEP